MPSCSGLQKYLNQQGFNIVGYGCTTCIGNSGDLDESVASAITENGMFLTLFSLLLIFCGGECNLVNKENAIW